MIRLITNVRDGKGLARDAELVAELCRLAGHDVETVGFRDAPSGESADLTISFEVVAPEHLGERNWWIPNPEWVLPGYTAHLPRFERVLCKTRDAARLFASVSTPGQVGHVGFISRDRLDATVPRERGFWHNPGGSTVKGTDAILQAWAHYRIALPLTVCGYMVNPIPIPHVSYRSRLPDDEHRREQNRHIFHLCLSWYEGWGHYLHEGLSCGAVLASTDHAPMTGFEAAVRVPVSAFGRQGLAETAAASPSAVRDAVLRMATMTNAEIADHGQRARAAYESESEAFRQRWAALMETL